MRREANGGVRHRQPHRLGVILRPSSKRHPRRISGVEGTRTPPEILPGEPAAGNRQDDGRRGWRGRRRNSGKRTTTKTPQGTKGWRKANRKKGKPQRHGASENEGVGMMPVQNRPPCRLRTTAGSRPRPWRGAVVLVRARPRERGRAPSTGPPPPFGRQTQPCLVFAVPPPSTGAPAATDLLPRQVSAPTSSAYREYACGVVASPSLHEAHRRRDAPSSASLRKANRTNASRECFGRP